MCLPQLIHNQAYFDSAIEDDRVPVKNDQLSNFYFIFFNIIVLFCFFSSGVFFFFPNLTAFSTRHNFFRKQVIRSQYMSSVKEAVPPPFHSNNIFVWAAIALFFILFSFLYL